MCIVVKERCWDMYEHLAGKKEVNAWIGSYSVLQVENAMKAILFICYAMIPAAAESVFVIQIKHKFTLFPLKFDY